LWSHLMIWPMLLSAILAGTNLYYWTPLWIIAETILLATMIISSFKVESLKKSYRILTYDRIIDFMHGKDPNNIYSSKLLNTVTFMYSFILCVGLFIILVLLSMYFFDVL